MRRLLPMLLGGLGTIVVVGLSVGNGLGGSLFLAVLAALGIPAAMAWRANRRDRQPDLGWARTHRVEFIPTTGHGPTSTGRVALALGRVETRELLTSASFGAGVGLALVNIVLFGFVWVDDAGGDLPRFLSFLAILVHPIVGLTMIAAFRARTRGRRDDVEELFESCPTDQATRSLGHLVTAGGGAAAALVAALASVVGLLLNADLLFGTVGTRQVTEVLVVAVLGAGAVALGTALARVLPWTIVSIAALVLVGFVSARLASSGRATDPVRQLSTFMGDLELDVRFTAPHHLAHLAWLAALAAVVGVLALVRDSRRPAVLAVGGVAVVVAVVSGWAATRPIDGADAVRIAALLDRATSQDCVAVGAVDVCAFPAEAELRDRVAAEVAPVVAAVPGDFEPVVLRYAATIDWSELDPEVRALVPEIEDEPGLLPYDMVGVDDSFEGARLWIGLAATGSLEHFGRGTPVELRGQARGVLALWLATRGVDAAAARALTSFVVQPDEGAAVGRPWPDPCYAGSAPAIWASSDVAAARVLVELPESQVAAALADGWDHFVEPTTTTDELLLAVGADPLGEPSGRTRLAEC